MSKPYRAEDYLTLPTGEQRQREEAPELRERLAKWKVDPSDFISGFRVTYRELDNICRVAQDNGWSGFIGLDEAVEAMFEPKPARRPRAKAAG